MEGPLPKNWVYFGVFQFALWGHLPPFPMQWQNATHGQSLRTICGHLLCSSLPWMDGVCWVEAFFFLRRHTSPSFTDWFGARGPPLPHWIKWESDKPRGCCQRVTFPRNVFAFLQEFWGEHASNQRKGFNHGNFRLREKLKEVMFLGT